MEWNLNKPVPEEINIDCPTCPSACCGPNIKIDLSDEERNFLQSAGTNLFPIHEIGNSYVIQYSMKSKCGFVKIDDGFQKCSVRENPQRPIACRDLKIGGEHCKKIKESRRSGFGYEFGF